MRKALFIGINYYDNATALEGCTKDAINLASELRNNEDGTTNFNCSILISENKKSSITRKKLKNEIEDLFSSTSDIALFYFSGHGHIEKTGGYLVTSDCRDFDDGLAMYELIGIANSSRTKNKIIILDCCYSGTVGSMTSNDAFSILSNGLTIFAASGPKKYSYEENGGGVFTRFLIDALRGGGANLMGEITPASVFSYIEKAFGPWMQRPVFKSNITEFVSLKQITPIIAKEILRYLTVIFPDPEAELPLDPSYEHTNTPEVAPPNHIVIKPYARPKNVSRFKILQKYQSIGLLVPVGAPFMYFAAMSNKSCKLTTLGKHYWRLVNEGRI